MGIFHPSRSAVVLSCPVPRGIPRVSFFFSPASDAGFLRFVRGSLAPRCFFVLFPAVFRGFPFFFSPASGAGVLPPLWRGKVLPFTVQSRDHLATITDIYVPSFLRPVRGSLAPRLLLSIPRHSMPAFILSIVPWRIALNWQFEREEPRGAMLRPRL